MNNAEIQLYLVNRYDNFFYWGQDKYELEKHYKARKQYAEDVKNGLCENYGY